MIAPEWGNVQVGDTVKMERDTDKQTAEIVVVAASTRVRRWITSDADTYHADEGWWIVSIERPEPPVVLPTESGWYSVSLDGSPYCRLLRISHDRIQEMLPAGYGPDGMHTPEHLAEVAIKDSRLTKLEPVPEIAKRVLDAVREALRVQSTFGPGTLARIGEQFGVTND